MKIYKTQKEVEKDIENGVLIIKGDVEFKCSISIDASIEVMGGNINVDGDLKAWNINAGNINVDGDLKAWNITTGDLTAGNITANNINAWNIITRNIKANDITAWNIDAENISYYAFCCVYNSIKCSSIKAERVVHQKPICLDGKLEIKKL